MKTSWWDPTLTLRDLAKTIYGTKKKKKKKSIGPNYHNIAFIYVPAHRDTLWILKEEIFIKQM